MAYVDIQNGDDSDGILVKLNKGLALADKSVITVDTAQDLRDLPMIGGSYPNQVNTRGALAVGDGGEGSWTWYLAATDTDNGFTILTPTGLVGPGGWLRVRDLEGPVFLSWGGYDQSGATAATSLIATAFSVASKEVIINSGVCLSGNISIPAGKQLTIKGGARLVPAAVTSEFILMADDSAACICLDGGQIDYTGTGISWSAVNITGDYCVADLLIRGLTAPTLSSDTVVSCCKITGDSARVSVRAYDCINTGNVNLSYPHTLSVQGGAIKCKVGICLNENGAGGIIVGDSQKLHIDLLECRSIADNGLYVLSTAIGTTCDTLIYDGDEEPLVDEGTDTFVSLVRVIDQQASIGIDDNATPLRIGRIELVTTDIARAKGITDGIIRSRSTNTSGAGVIVGEIVGDSYGSRLFKFTSGDVARVELHNVRVRQIWHDESVAKIVFSHTSGDYSIFHNSAIEVHDSTGLLTSSAIFETVFPSAVGVRGSYRGVSVFMSGGAQIYRGRNIIQNNVDVDGPTVQFVSTNAYIREDYYLAGDRKIVYSTTAPTAGAWKAGDIVLKANTVSGAPFGWQCVVSGTPGTWETVSTLL